MKIGLSLTNASLRMSGLKCPPCGKLQKLGELMLTMGISEKDDKEFHCCKVCGSKLRVRKGVNRVLFGLAWFGSLVGGFFLIILPMLKYLGVEVFGDTHLWLTIGLIAFCWLFLGTVTMLFSARLLEVEQIL
jgi:hypothetical protein